MYIYVYVYIYIFKFDPQLTHKNEPMSYCLVVNIYFLQAFGKNDGLNICIPDSHWHHWQVIAADLEAFDPEYFSNLKWMLDNVSCFSAV